MTATPRFVAHYRVSIRIEAHVAGARGVACVEFVEMESGR